MQDGLGGRNLGEGRSLLLSVLVDLLCGMGVRWGGVNGLGERRPAGEWDGSHLCVGEKLVLDHHPNGSGKVAACGCADLRECGDILVVRPVNLQRQLGQPVGASSNSSGRRLGTATTG